MKVKKSFLQHVSMFMAGIICFGAVNGAMTVKAEALEAEVSEVLEVLEVGVPENNIKVYLADDFEIYEGLGAPPSGYEFTGGADVKSTSGAMNNPLTEPNSTSVGLRIEETVPDRDAKNGPDGGVAKRFGSDNLTGEIIIDLDMKMLDANGTRFIEMQNSSKKGLTLANVTYKNISLEGKSVKIPLQQGEWNRLSFAIHFDADPTRHTVTLYVNGEEKIKGYNFTNANKMDALNYVRIRQKREIQSKLAEDLEGNRNETVLIDNLRVYSGTELKTMEELKELNVPDSLMDFDNDLGISVADRLSGSLAMVVNSRNVIFDNQKKKEALEAENRPAKLNGEVLVPFGYLCHTFGETLNLDGTGGQASVTIGGVNSVITPEKIETGGEVIASSGIQFTSNEVLIPLQAAGRILGKPVYTDYKGRGLIVIGSGAGKFDDSKDVVDEAVAPKNNEKFFIEEAIKEIVYDRTAGDDVIALLKENNASHPRIIATESDFDRIKQMIDGGEPTVAKWYQDIIKQGEKHLAMPVVTNDLPDGRRMIGSRQVGPLVINLGMLYHLSNDPVKKEAYKARIWEEVSTAAAFPNWNESNEFLNTAEFMEGLAIAYDWMYDEWTPEQRKLLEDAIIQKGLVKSLEAYNNNVWWIHTYPRANNWNAVCNGSTSLALMAIGDIDREIELPSREKVSMEKFGGKLLDIAFNALEDFILLEFTPDGAWSEGPSYWKYTFEYLVKFMSSLETALGTCYGYDQTPGLDKTAYFPIYLSGEVGALNYGDASNNKVIAAEELWVAKKYGDNRLASIHLDSKTKNKNAGSEFELLWYEPDAYIPNQKPELDQYFSGTEVATFRSKWDDPSTSFLGLKAGNNVVSHGHYDLGSFVYEALGQQWAIDLGKDDYNLPGYSNYEKERLTYYRLNPEGHNTLVINPDGTAQQNIKAFSKIERMESKPRGGFAITDLTEAYKSQVVAAKRGVMLYSNRTRAVIQDEVTFISPSEAYWFMHTESQVEISEDGKSAILSKGGEKLWVGLNCTALDGNGTEVEAVFGVMDAKPLPVSPNPEKQNPNDGIRKLFIKLENVKEMTLTVTMIPVIGSLEELNKTVTVKPLESWNISDGELTVPVLEGVSLDGEPLQGFDPNNFGYDINLPLERTEAPVVAYTYDSTLYDVQMTAADTVPGTTKLIVTSLTSPEIKSVYSFNFKLMPLNGEEERLVEVPIASVSASDAQVGNPEGNAVDGDFNTYWGAEGDQWIRLDLGEEKTVNSVGIAFIRGNERSFKFDIETSVDGENWELKYSGISSGESLELEKVYLRQCTARYVRITGHGNSVNRWNSYAELRVYRLPESEPDIDLAALIEQALEYLNGAYTEESLTILREAVEAARAVLNTPEAAQDDVKEAAAKLKEAIDTLIPLTGTDKQALKAALEAVLEILKEEEKYTAESIAGLKAAHNSAMEVYNNPDVTEQETAEALKQLQDAIDALETVTGDGSEAEVDKASLEEIIALAKGLAGDLYTQESYDAVLTALMIAEAVLADENATQEAVDHAATALVNAVDALKTRPSVSDNDPGNDTRKQDNREHYREPEADWKEITSQLKKTVNEAVNKASRSPIVGREVSVILNAVTGKTIEVPADLLGMMRGRPVTVAFHTGSGITFSLNGMQIADKTMEKPLDLSIRRDAGGMIPSAVVAPKQSGSGLSRQFSMLNRESFGMPVNLHVDMKAVNAGRYANLYLYNSKTQQLEYMSSFKITDNGQAMFAISRGADYLVTVTDQKADESDSSRRR